MSETSTGSPKEPTLDGGPDINDTQLYEMLYRICVGMGLPLEETGLNQGRVSTAEHGSAPLRALLSVAGQFGVSFDITSKLNEDDIRDFVADRRPVVMLMSEKQVMVLESVAGRFVEGSIIEGGEARNTQFSMNDIRHALLNSKDHYLLIAQRDLQCNVLSAAGGKKKLAPTRRWWSLLKLDGRDIVTLTLFGLVAGFLTLATPLAIESLVNVVSWGTYTQPLIVLSIMLLACLGIAGILNVLQTVIVEVIQRRQLVRIVGDLAHRFPRVDPRGLVGKFPREYANRVLDIVTIQKATAVLLLDGISIVLTTVFGLLLLAFYHPFLLGFDIVLVISMVSITWILGRGGIRTALAESNVKYKIVHWLQDVLASPAAFKVNGGERLAIEKANRLAADYVQARQQQFRVVIRQVAFAIGLQVVASTAVLALGGYLVMNNQLTLGQLVASELVVTVVVGAFSKAGKSLEKFYDLMAGIDKVGYLLDLPVQPRGDQIPDNVPAGKLTWQNLLIDGCNGVHRIENGEIDPGKSIALFGDDPAARERLAKSFAGLAKPKGGIIELSGVPTQKSAAGSNGSFTGYAGLPEIMNLSIAQNVALGRTSVGAMQIRESLKAVGLWEMISAIDHGVDAVLQTDGAPLSRSDAQLLGVARMLAKRPRLMVVDSIIDDLPKYRRDALLDELLRHCDQCIVVISTRDAEIADRCDLKLEVNVA